ncbi:hypothetical protein [Litoreibacter arenae]|uniref:Uncharacterized protein n=1 Tax=Litoreibacter arenae DSM 19593 TaxID=1123360 RepID=S9RZ05_9RHOB|nr:hypothetical protein [Litoreibacter arenae]EPX79204.1 hypothetical protein thalar_02029 [Litoreibacter arenae DSM 19593]
MWKYVAVFTTLTLPISADVTSPSGRTVECYCTDKSGARVELGEQRCLSVGGRVFMARCEMSLNVPMWRETGQSCVTG